MNTIVCWNGSGFYGSYVGAEGYSVVFWHCAWQCQEEGQYDEYEDASEAARWRGLGTISFYRTVEEFLRDCPGAEVIDWTK